MRNDDYYENQEVVRQIAPLVERLKKVQEEFTVLQAEMDELIMKVSAEFPEDAGEHIKEIGPYRVTCNRAERWVWDKEKLEAIYNANPQLPDYVKKTYSVDKRKYQTLGDEEKSLLRDALERKPIKAKIKIED